MNLKIFLIIFFINTIKLIDSQWNYPCKTRPNVPIYYRRNFDTGNFLSLHKNWHLLPKECGISTTNDRITGGINAELGQYTWMARIGYKNIHKIHKLAMFRCGATIITKDHVLTAAHCIKNIPADVFVAVVRLGEYDSEKKIDCNEHTCANPVVDIIPKLIIVHEKHGQPENRNDICLIKLKESIPFNMWVSPICLPFDALLTKNFTNSSGEVAGWGYYDLNVNKGSNILQTVTLPIINSYKCEKAYKSLNISDKFQLCVGGDIGKDSCNGDSGGPLMRVEDLGRGPRYFIIGMVSFGVKYCGLSAVPATYTRISSYMSWILDHLSD